MSLGALLLRGLGVLVVSVVIAVIVFAAGNAIPAKYSSSATVAVNVSGSDINDTSLGADNLASQYAQQVNATPVLQSASKMLGGAAIPSGSISGGAVAAQNAIAVQATADSASQAQARAAAVTKAFVSYVNNAVTRQANAYAGSATTALKPLEAQIARVQAKLVSVGSSTPGGTVSAATEALEQELGTLTAQRANALSSIAQTAVAGRPSITVVSAAGVGSKTAPKPTLYALVAFILALLITGRIAVYMAARNRASA